MSEPDFRTKLVSFGDDFGAFPKEWWGRRDWMIAEVCREDELAPVG
jgi:hypothetical protein